MHKYAVANSQIRIISDKIRTCGSKAQRQVAVYKNFTIDAKIIYNFML